MDAAGGRLDVFPILVSERGVPLGAVGVNPLEVTRG
jgi:hypothetical protein